MKMLWPLECARIDSNVLKMVILILVREDPKRLLRPAIVEEDELSTLFNEYSQLTHGLALQLEVDQSTIVCHLNAMRNVWKSEKLHISYLNAQLTIELSLLAKQKNKFFVMYYN